MLGHAVYRFVSPPVITILVIVLVNIAIGMRWTLIVLLNIENLKF